MPTIDHGLPLSSHGVTFVGGSYAHRDRSPLLSRPASYPSFSLLHPLPAHRFPDPPVRFRQRRISHTPDSRDCGSMPEPTAAVLVVGKVVGRPRTTLTLHASCAQLPRTTVPPSGHLIPEI